MMSSVFGSSSRALDSSRQVRHRSFHLVYFPRRKIVGRLVGPSGSQAVLASQAGQVPGTDHSPPHSTVGVIVCSSTYPWTWFHLFRVPSLRSIGWRRSPLNLQNVLAEIPPPEPYLRLVS
jgi:hypothetical protein